jgi:phosphoglycolate phosphatase-like HAD superfamily hydrolase
MKKTVIFDLDGTLADIEKRRVLATKATGRIDWDVFFNPENITLDEPNHSVIEMAKMLKKQGYSIVILSGRSKATKVTTMEWLDRFNVPFDVLKMRPTSSEFMSMPDDELKQRWLDQLFPDKDTILCVFDDRDKVVNMWRANGLSCFQVAPGNF